MVFGIALWGTSIPRLKTYLTETKKELEALIDRINVFEDQSVEIIFRYSDPVREILRIMVKDFSRFARNFLDMGEYLEQIFPFLGIRFISVNDHYDSQNGETSASDWNVVFKNFLYDLYSKDLSQKTRAARRTKAKKGRVSDFCYRSWEHKDEICLTPATQALPLFWGLVPKEREANVVQAFRYSLERDGAFYCGEVGLHYVIQMARKYGMNDLIATYIRKEIHPSYYAFVLDGETTLGEYWESNPRSHCHDMMGHIIEWYYNGIAGIQPLEPGFSSIRIKPYLPEGVHEVDCSYSSVSGKIYVHIREKDGIVRLETAVAPQIRYQIDLADLKKRGLDVEHVIINEPM